MSAASHVVSGLEFVCFRIETLLTPTIHGEDDESHDGAAATPFVADLFEVAKSAVGSLDVIVGPNTLTGGAVQVGDHFVELVGAQHRQRLGEIGVGQEFGIVHESGPSALGLVGAEVGIEQAIDLEDETPQGAQLGQMLEHLAEAPSLAAVEMFRTGDDEMAMFPDEIRLLFLGRAAPVAGAFLGFAQAAAARSAFGFVGVFATQTPQGVEDAVVDVFDDVEDTELVAGLGPDLGQHLGIKIRAVADDDGRLKAMIPEIEQEATHVALVVGRDHSEGHGEIAEGIGGQEQSAMAEVEFVDAQGAGELLKRPLPVRGQVDLADLPIEAVVQEAVGEIELEVAFQSVLQTIDAHAVFEQAIDDEIAHAIGILGAWLDAVDLRAEGLAARTGRAVFSDGQFDDHDLAEREFADRSSMSVFASSKLAALRTRIPLGGAFLLDDANARINGFHACVPHGLGWLPHEGAGSHFFGRSLSGMG